MSSEEQDRVLREHGYRAIGDAIQKAQDDAREQGHVRDFPLHRSTCPAFLDATKGCTCGMGQ